MPIDAAIIGGGPAGCACALHMARRGLHVVLIERSAFPRQKVCGESLSPAALAELAPFGGEQLLRCAGAQRIDALEIALPGKPVARWRLPRAGWSLSRGALDALLLKTAADAGANVEQPASARDVAYHPDHVRLMLADGGAIDARCVIHADGVGRLDPAGPVRTRPGAMGIKRLLRLDQPMGAALRMHGFSSPDGRAYFGLSDVEGGLTTMAAAADASLLRACGGDTDALARLLWPGYDEAQPVGPWQACPIAAADYTRPGHVRSFRIGNAAGAVEPIGGEGIGLALWAGRTLAGMIDVQHPAHTHKRFARVYRRRLAVRRPACAAAAWLLARPGLVGPTLPALRRRPGALLGPAYRLLRGHAAQAGA